MSPMVTRATGPYTRSDLVNTPDDGRRYEVIDGHLHVGEARLPFPVTVVPAELVR